jgi:curved DNA-binding protein CbpA
MDDEDLYATLGVDPSADAESVRRAYRKLAVRWHPDKNPGDSATAEVMFKKVAAAYEVLSDERKRAAYDGERAERRAGTHPRGGARRGARAPGGASPFGAEFGFGGGFAPHHNPFEVFREAFGGRDPFADDPFFAAARSRFGPAPRASLFRDADPPASAALGAGFGVPFFDAFEALAREPFGEPSFGEPPFGEPSFGGVRERGAHRSFRGDDSRGGVARSTSSQTVVIDGRRRTRATTTIRHADGRVETFTDEHVDDDFPAARVRGRDRDAALPRGAGGGHSRLARRGYF